MSPLARAAGTRPPLLLELLDLFVLQRVLSCFGRRRKAFSAPRRNRSGHSSTSATVSPCLGAAACADVSPFRMQREAHGAPDRVTAALDGKTPNRSMRPMICLKRCCVKPRYSFGTWGTSGRLREPGRRPGRVGPGPGVAAPALGHRGPQRPGLGGGVQRGRVGHRESLGAAATRGGDGQRVRGDAGTRGRPARAERRDVPPRQVLTSPLPPFLDRTSGGGAE